VSHLNRIRHYRGLDGALDRIERLLEEFSFIDIASYLAAIEASTAASLAMGAA
jgi:hypothetical protein